LVSALWHSNTFSAIYITGWAEKSLRKIVKQHAELRRLQVPAATPQICATVVSSAQACPMQCIAFKYVSVLGRDSPPPATMVQILPLGFRMDSFKDAPEEHKTFLTIVQSSMRWHLSWSPTQYGNIALPSSCMHASMSWQQIGHGCAVWQRNGGVFEIIAVIENGMQDMMHGTCIQTDCMCVLSPQQLAHVELVGQYLWWLIAQCRHRHPCATAFTCIAVKVMHMLFSRCHGPSKRQRELKVSPLFATLESCCVIKLASHVQRKWHAFGI